MKIVTMEGEFWWFVRPDDLRPVRGLTIHQIVRKIQETFGFLSVPSSLPEEGRPLVFREGMLKHAEETIPIKFLEAYNDGTHIKVDSSTDDADMVFRKLRELVVELGGRADVIPLLTYHVSTIVAEFDNNINQALKDFGKIADLISNHLDVPASVGLKGLYFQADPQNLPRVSAKINPTGFRVETRIDTALQEKRYFSTANMSTGNHIKVLTALESMLAA
jgi:hypothetical protein